jgi:hypothetical protein
VARSRCCQSEEDDFHAEDHYEGVLAALPALAPCGEIHGRMAEKCLIPVYSYCSLDRYCTAEGWESRCKDCEVIHGEISAAEQTCRHFRGRRIAFLD